MERQSTLHRIPQRRGFAAMSPDRHKQISAKGGKAVPAGKRTYARDRDIAAASGRQARANSVGLQEGND